MSKNDDLYLRHMLDAIESIERFLDGISFDAFKTNELLMSGVHRKLEIIGEAAGKISQEFRDTHSVIPWFDIISTRNHIIHEYTGIDDQLIWQTCIEDIPRLKEFLHSIMNQ